MNIEEILTDSGRATADMCVDIISQRPELLEQAYSLCMAEDGKPSMRAARVVQLVAEQYPEMMKPFFPDMVTRLQDLTHSSVKRCMMKVVTFYDLSEYEDLHGILIDTAFMRMNDPDEETAIRAYSIGVLERLVKTYPEISGELIAALNMMADTSKETLSKYAKKVLRKLYREAAG